MISQLLTHPIQRTFKHTPSDPQRSRLYKMEREFVGASVYHSVSRKNLQLVADHVCAYYRITPIKIVVYRDPSSRIFGESIAYSNDDWETSYGHVIRLNRGFHGANVPTLLHELAHYICDATYKNHRGHGSQFAAIYMHLLDKYRILPAVAFRALAKKWGVKVAGRFRPAAIRG